MLGRLRSRRFVTRTAAVLGACLLAALAIATCAYAAPPKLALVSDGEPVPSGQRSAVITSASFPGFTCEGFGGSMEFLGGPKLVLKFSSREAEGGDEAFDSCETGSGETVATGQEVTEFGPSKLQLVTVTSEAVTETFRPAAMFDDTETGCVWTLHKLAGPLPSSGELAEVPLSGTVRLRPRLSAHTCPETGAVSATATIEAAPEGAPPGSYTVEQVE